MKRNLLAFLCGVLVFCSIGISYADSISFDLNFEYSGGTNPAGPAPWLTATFEDVKIGGLDFVMLTMDASGLRGKEFVSSWGFNIDPTYEKRVAVTFVSGSGPGPIGTTVSPIKQNAYEVGPAFGFDFEFDFPNDTGKDDPFGAGETLVYSFLGSGLTAASFNFQNTIGKGPFYSAAHVQSIGLNSGSGYIGTGGKNPTPVPEPATMLLLSAGLIGLGFFGRKRSLK